MTHPPTAPQTSEITPKATREITGEVTGGVDTHRDTHTAAALDSTGRLLGHHQFPATPTGYTALLDWLHTFGPVVLVGIEGSGAYGAGLTGYLRTAGVRLVEVDRPDRSTRRQHGKSDPIDAEAAAHAAQSGRATGIPKLREGQVEATRVLRIARRSAVDQRAHTQTRIKSLIITAPEPLRAQLRALSDRELITHCATRRPRPAQPAPTSAANPTSAAAPATAPATGLVTDPGTDPATALLIALRSLARRHQHLTTEIAELDSLITPLVAAINPTLIALLGVGTDTAAQLLVTAGENPHRLHSEAAFAMLCGVAPLPASSGRTHRHRLNRGGDRQANAAIYRIVLCRLRWDPRTRAYAHRRTTQGLTKKEIIRCLKRYIIREIYAALLTQHDLQTAG